MKLKMNILIFTREQPLQKRQLITIIMKTPSVGWVDSFWMQLLILLRLVCCFVSKIWPIISLSQMNQKSLVYWTHRTIYKHVARIKTIPWGRLSVLFIVYIIINRLLFSDRCYGEPAPYVQFNFKVGTSNTSENMCSNTSFNFESANITVK